MNAGKTKRLEELERENAYSETFISPFSEEVFECEVFNDLLEAKVLIDHHPDHEEYHRPHSALSCRIPAEFGASADLDRKVEDVRKPKESESIVTLS